MFEWLIRELSLTGKEAIAWIMDNTFAKARNAAEWLGQQIFNRHARITYFDAAAYHFRSHRVAHWCSLFVFGFSGQLTQILRCAFQKCLCARYL